MAPHKTITGITGMPYETYDTRDVKATPRNILNNINNGCPALLHVDMNSPDFTNEHVWEREDNNHTLLIYGCDLDFEDRYNRTAFGYYYVIDSWGQSNELTGTRIKSKSNRRVQREDKSIRINEITGVDFAENLFWR